MPIIRAGESGNTYSYRRAKQHQSPLLKWPCQTRPYASTFRSRRFRRWTIDPRPRRRGIALPVQSHNSWADLWSPSFWITLQISQFMVPSSFPVVVVTHWLWSSIHHCSIILGLPFYSQSSCHQRTACVAFMPDAPVDQTCGRPGNGRNPAATASQDSFI